MKYFIALRWRNKDKALELYDKLKQKAGKDNVYCCFDNKYSSHLVEQDPEETMKDFENIKDWRNDEFVKNIFKTDLDELKKADAVILLLPAGKSAHMEIGIAYGMGKKCILVGKAEETESLYLIFDEFYDTIDDFIDSL